MTQSKKIEQCGYCKKEADWIYMPFGSYFCDDCVPRGCSCNNEFLDMEARFPNKYKQGSDYLESLIEYRAKFRIDDIKINGEEAPYLSHKIIIPLDEQGREYPCVEYMRLDLDAELIAKFY